MRGVDSTIAQLQRGFYGCDNNIIFQTEGAKTNAGIAMIFLVISSFRLTDEIMADGVEGKRAINAEDFC
ncbi:hypothetical protein LNO78_04295 [Klebsiella pneumoniae subsp. pneumoniae]|nr:hypothetical protein [Klebsiella pneumoniae subsp. pneumoniae]